jgi:hypothetical protein
MLSLKGKITREYPSSLVNQFDELLADIVKLLTSLENVAILLKFIKMLSTV